MTEHMFVKKVAHSSRTVRYYRRLNSIFYAVTRTVGQRASVPLHPTN